MPTLSRLVLAPMAVALAAGHAAAADDFARLAPPGAGLVLNVADFQRTKERLLSTPLGRLTEAGPIAEMLEQARGSQLERFEALATELGIDVEDWPEPAGMMGFAMIMRPVENAMPWESSVLPTFIGAIDFGDEIATIREMLEAMVDRGLDRGLIEVESEWVGEVEVFTIRSLLDHDAMDDGMDFAFNPVGGGLEDMISGLEDVSLAIHGTVLLLGAEKELVLDAVDRSLGGNGASLAQDEHYLAALRQHPAGTTDHLVVFPGRMGFVETLSMSAGFFLPPDVNIGNILSDLGISGMRAVGVGLRPESADAQAELTLGVLCPQKRGLISLLDTTGAAWRPPSFASPDAVAATRLLVDFGAIPDVVREIWGTFPADIRNEGGMIFEQVMAFIEPIAPLLGPEVHIIQTLSRPLEVGSAGMLYAIPTSNELPLSNLLVLGSTNGAFTARDFGGTKIYDAQMGGISVAVGYGHIFAGPATSVEGALRMAASPREESLSDDPDFAAAMRPLAGTGNVMQFTRTVDILEFTLWTLTNMREITIAQLREVGWSDEDIEMYAPAEDVPDWARLVTPELISRGVGDISMEIAPSRDGFRGRILIHAPR